MASSPWPGPRRSVEALALRHGHDAVVAACLTLLAGNPADPEMVVGLGGPPARLAAAGTPSPDYWLRVWALRGLLWDWDPAASRALVIALADEAWRVREMAAKVATRHLLEEAMDALLLLREDDVPRVRAAAERAVIRLTSERR